MIGLDEVKAFWEANPLWTGESEFDPGSSRFFEEHRNIYLKDCFAGRFDVRFLPQPRVLGQKMRILDLGCGIGFWVTEFAMRGLHNLEAADLTQKALKITKRRLELHGSQAELSLQNAEKLGFESSTFDHVNCQGVIHHTPDVGKAVAEIARVLKTNGTASISVYYKNIFLRLWPILRWAGWLFAKLGAELKGRGRESIFTTKDVNELVRQYDGADNPLGKSYTRQEFIALLQPYFLIEDIYFHFFPARAFPFKIPETLHRWLDKNCGFMIYATLRKP
jgi:2-polyprenyl-3-methyl-5-hydroxy-6-metoxy-1,4-benzoquinol methylase